MEVEASLIGRTLASRYRIDRCIGRGGMATVYAARVESGEGAGNEIALKVVNRELTRDPTVLRRFHREAKAASRLKHPNTVEVYEYGVDGDDAFIAMELAGGTDLLQALSAENPMRQARAALVVSQVCAGLAAAHAQGIIHRDLKPENVMLIPDDQAPGGERVKVLDFGIAKIMESSKASGDDDQPSYVTKTALTRVGTIVGTPAYMSPEQCRGGDLDGRSDVYSCGVLLYQLLTGEVPFAGETPLHTAMRHIHAQPKPLRDLRADISPALEKIVLKALAKWPGERHQTADALAQELEAILRELPDAASLKLPAKAIVIGKNADAATVLETELFIQSDPRMENGALGAGKLGSVRLGSLGALRAGMRSTKLGTEPAKSEGTPTATATTAATPTAKLPMKSSDAPRPGAPSPPGAKQNSPVLGSVSLGRGAALGSAAHRAESATGAATAAETAPRAAKPPPPKALDTPTNVRTDGLEPVRPEPPRAQPPRAPANAREPAKTARSEPSRPARTPRTTEPGESTDGTEPRTLQKNDAPSDRRPTETGLTPTSQMPRDQIADHESRATSPHAGPPADDEDEPQTFIRAPQPTDVAGYESDERPAHKTLVMDEPSAPGPSPGPRRADPNAGGRALAPTVGANEPADPARRNAIDSAWDEMSRKVQLNRDQQAQAGAAGPSMLQSGQRLGDTTGGRPGLPGPNALSSSGSMPSAVSLQQQQAQQQLGQSSQNIAHPGTAGYGQPANPARLLPPLQQQQFPSGMQQPQQGPGSRPMTPPQPIPAVGAEYPPRSAPFSTSGAFPAASAIANAAGGPPQSAPRSGGDFNDISSISSVSQLRPQDQAQVKSTIRIPADATDVARSPYPVGANRPGKSGLRGRLEELSGTVLLLIGIAVGLFIALIGLVIVLVTR